MLRSNIVVIIIAVIVALVIGLGTFTNYWTVYSRNIQNPANPSDTISAKYNSGLWKTCISLDDVKNCADTKHASKTQDSNNLNGSKGAAIIGFSLIILGVIILIFAPKTYIAFTIAFILGGIASVASAISWASDRTLNPDDTSYGYSYYLELIGGIIAVVFALYAQIKLKPT